MHFDSFSVTDQIAADPIAVCKFTVLYGEIYRYRSEKHSQDPDFSVKRSETRI